MNDWTTVTRQQLYGMVWADSSVSRGASWVPVDQHQMMSARRSLLMMAADYVVEFVWIMQRYQAFKRKDIETLLGTPAMRRSVVNERKRLDELVAALPAESLP